MQGIRGSMTRRGALRAGAAAAGVAAAGWTLAGCAGGAANTAGSSAAAPLPVISGTRVPFQLWVPGLPFSKEVINLVQQFTDQSFNAKHKGINAVWVGGGNMQQVATDVLAGTMTQTPWVVASCCADWPIIQPFLARLDPYLKKDNIDIATTWHPGQLSRFREPDGLYGLPEDAESDAYLYRQDILDQLGLAYPDPTWDWQQAQSIWQACTGHTGKNGWRYGVACPFGQGTTEGVPTVVAGFGGAYQNAQRTRCLLDQPEAIAAGDYWIHMVWDKVATNGDGVPNPGIWTGSVVFSTGADPTILQAVQHLGNSAKWDFLPWPRFPARSVGKLHDNFYGMLQAAPHPEIAWEILKWAAIEPEWQRFYMKLALAPPALASLLQEWFTVIRSVAPVLKNKHLEYWAQPTLAGEGVYDFEFFKYAPVQANDVLSAEWSKIWTRQTTVSAGFRSIAQQINALEASGKVQQANLASVNKEFPTKGSPIAAVQPGL